jgi:hypothetical protein
MEGKMTKINVPLSQPEVDALVAIANREYRHPREQARYMIREALVQQGLLQPEPAQWPAMQPAGAST